MSGARESRDRGGCSEALERGGVQRALDIGNDPVRRHQGAHQQGASNKQADHCTDPRSPPKAADCLQICTMIHGLRPAVVLSRGVY